MGLFSFFKREAEEVSVIFYMGSSSVAAAIVQFHPSKSPKVVFTTHEQIALTERPDSKKFLSIMSNALDETAKKIHKDGLLRYAEITGKKIKHIKSIHCVLSSPWYASQTRILKINNEKPFLITPTFINNLIEKEVISTEKNGGTQAPIVYKDSAIIERKVMQIQLNGYDVSDPHNKLTNHAELSLFISATSGDVLSKIESCIRKHFNFNTLQFHSFALVVFSALRDMQNVGRNFLAIDVGGEITDIAVVKDNVVLETISFPLGKNSLIRHVANDFGVTSEIALSTLKMFSEGNLDKAEVVKIESIVKDFEQEWSRRFHTSLLDISRTIFIPKKIFITVSKNVSPFFLRFLKKEHYSDFMPVQDNFTIIPFNELELQSICEYHPRAIQDPFLALESAFIDKVRKNTA